MLLSGKDRPVTVALADGNPLVLSAMSEIFDRDPRFSLVATTATAEGFLGAVIRIPVSVGIIDWNLPALGGHKLIEVLRDQANAPRLIVYGDDSRGEVPRQAILAGAAGFVARNTPVDKLLDTCLAVAAGQMVFPFLDVRELQAENQRLRDENNRLKGEQGKPDIKANKPPNHQLPAIIRRKPNGISRRPGTRAQSVTASSSTVKRLSPWIVPVCPRMPRYAC